MDEIDENKSEQELPTGDQNTLRSEGVEIVNYQETPADKAIAEEAKIPITPVVPTAQPVGQAPVAPAYKDYIQSVRTYRSDAEEAVKKNNTSVIDIAVAESKKREEKPQQTMVDAGDKKSKEFMWFAIGLIGIAILVIAGTYYFLVVGSQTLSQTETNTTNSYPSIIQAQSTQTIPISTKNPLQSLGTTIENISSVPVGSVVNIIPTGENGVAIATSSDFFSAIGIPLPTQMSFALDGTYMLGTIISDPNHPFVILGVSSFENAFAGMIAWEKTLRNDFAGLIQIDHPSEPSVPLVPEAFTDTTIQNQDVREIENASSSPILLYTFVGTTKLVITTDSATMAHVITELNTTNTTR